MGNSTNDAPYPYPDPANNTSTAIASDDLANTTGEPVAMGPKPHKID